MQKIDIEWSAIEHFSYQFDNIEITKEKQLHYQFLDGKWGYRFIYKFKTKDGSSLIDDDYSNYFGYTVPEGWRIGYTSLFLEGEVLEKRTSATTAGKTGISYGEGESTKAIYFTHLPGYDMFGPFQRVTLSAEKVEDPKPISEIQVEILLYPEE